MIILRPWHRSVADNPRLGSGYVPIQVVLPSPRLGTSWRRTRYSALCKSHHISWFLGGGPSESHAEDLLAEEPDTALSVSFDLCRRSQ